MDLIDVEVGQAVLYKPGTRMQRRGTVVAVDTDLGVTVKFDHDQSGDMTEELDPADLQLIDLTPPPELS